MVKKKVSNKKVPVSGGMNKNLVVGLVVVLLLVGVFLYFNNQKEVGLSPGMPDDGMPGEGGGTTEVIDCGLKTVVWGDRICKYPQYANVIDAIKPRVTWVFERPANIEYWACSWSCGCWYRAAPLKCSDDSDPVSTNSCPTKDWENIGGRIKYLDLGEEERDKAEQRCNNYVEKSGGDADIACAGQCFRSAYTEDGQKKDPFDEKISIACCV